VTTAAAVLNRRPPARRDAAQIALLDEEVVRLSLQKSQTGRPATTRRILSEYASLSAWARGAWTAGPRLALRSRNWIPVSSIAFPISRRGRRSPGPDDPWPARRWRGCTTCGRSRGVDRDQGGCAPCAPRRAPPRSRHGPRRSPRRRRRGPPCSLPDAEALEDPVVDPVDPDLARDLAERSSPSLRSRTRYSSEAPRRRRPRRAPAPPPPSEQVALADVGQEDLLARGDRRSTDRLGQPPSEIGIPSPFFAETSKAACRRRR